MAVVGGRDHQRVAVLLGELESLLHSLVEVDGLADLTAGIGSLVAFVDRRALDLEEEALGRVLRSLCARREQFDCLARHVCEFGHIGAPLGVVAALGRRLQITLSH